MFCTKCGTILSDGARFCGRCGAPTGEPPRQPQQAQQPQQPQQASAYQQPQQSQQAPVYQQPAAANTPPVFQSGGAQVAAAAVKTGMGLGAKLLIAVLMVTVVVGGVWFVREQMVSPEDRICATVAQLESSFNAMDIDGMLDCCEPSVRSMYDMAMSMTGGLLGYATGYDDFGTIMEGMIAMAPLLAESGYGEMSGMPQLQLDVQNIRFVNDSIADVTLLVTLAGDGESESETLVIRMVEGDGDWLVAASNLLEYAS